MSDAIQLPGLLEEATAAPAAPGIGGIEVSTYDGPDAPGGKAVAILHLTAPAEMVLLHAPGAASVGAKLLAAVPELDSACGQLVIDLCMFVIDHVYDCRGDLKPASGAAKHELMERHRRTLSKRLEVMLNSQREKKTLSNHALAKQMVDTMMSAVFS